MSQQPPQWQPTNPPVPQARQSWFARHKVLSVVLGIVLVVVLICCGAGVLSVGGDDSSTSAGTESSQTSEATQESDDATDETTAEESKEAAPETQETAEESKDAAPEEPELSTEQQNAIRAAEDYLEFMPFSKQGLIDQLSSPAGDGYPRDVARFAVEHIESDVDWDEQAVKAAESYLDLMAFSRSGLIDQLTSDAGDGYTQEQAEHAADQVGL
ncbi:Ltp family lipoprotein [Janibacter alittae]|uniref:Ltp family lipoprotein n=1 Tax=Janibacter alittae TaxID=3115209 RepID=A0ABZ2MHV0_9MICO